MKQHSKNPPPGPIVASPQEQAKLQKLKQQEQAEPFEVLGRHRNTGQKDHKGAR
jgi:hypothetical protein